MFNNEQVVHIKIGVTKTTTWMCCAYGGKLGPTNENWIDELRYRFEPRPDENWNPGIAYTDTKYQVLWKLMKIFEILGLFVILKNN